MGCGQSAAADDAWAEKCKHMSKLFDQRAGTIDYEEVESIVSSLFACLDGQQLKKQTWEYINNLRTALTRGTPKDSKLYHQSGYRFYGV